MLTHHFAKTLRHAALRAESAHNLPARAEPNSGIDRPAHGLNFRYWIRDCLLSGNQGAVYQAHDISLNRPCSVKLVASSARDKTTIEQRFLNEAEILSRLSHNNIVEVYECTRDEQGNLFSVMEPLDGRDLDSLLAEATVLPLERTLEIVSAVGAALQHVHDLGIVHQDINPSSIFLNKERSRTAPAVEVIKVMNFGHAKHLKRDSGDKGRNLHLGLVFNSPTYLAPEELELSNEWVDDRADQWSLAVVAFQMLSGRLPFWASDPWELRALIRSATAPLSLAALMPELPSYVLDAIQKALSKDKYQRHASVKDFIRALHGLPTSPSKQTKKELRPDLIEQCRSVISLLEAAHTSLPMETPTREYPALSFPSELLASSEDELVPVAVTDPGLPIPQLTLPWTAGEETPRPLRTGRRLWLVGCIVMALLPVLVFAAWRYLQRAPHVSAATSQRAPQLERRQPRMVVAATPGATDALPPAPPASLVPLPVAQKYKPVQPHRARPRAPLKVAASRLDAAGCRNELNRKLAQETLVKGLGL